MPQLGAEQLGSSDSSRLRSRQTGPFSGEEHQGIGDLGLLPPRGLKMLARGLEPRYHSLCELP